MQVIELITENKTQIGAFPSVPHPDLDSMNIVVYSRAIDFLERSQILSARYLQPRSAFAVFDSFEPLLWVYIIFALLTLGTTCAILNPTPGLNFLGKIQKMISYTWDFSNVILSQAVSRIPKKWSVRKLYGILLLMNVALLSCLNAKMFDQMMAKNSYDQVDSINDALKRLKLNPDMKISVVNKSPVHSYVDMVLGENSKNRTNIVDLMSFFNISYAMNDMRLVAEGKLILTLNKLWTRYYISEYSRKFPDRKPNFNNHMAKQGLYLMPYFVIVNKLAHPSTEKGLNKM